MATPNSQERYISALKPNLRNPKFGLFSIDVLLNGVEKHKLKER
jgi:hypothetical protein